MRIEPAQSNLVVQAQRAVPATPRAAEAAPVPAASSASSSGASTSKPDNQAQQEFFRAASRLREAIGPTSTTYLHFNVDPSSKHVQVMLVDQSTGEVVREIPPDTLRHFAEAWDAYLGSLIDREA